ncbi:unnamed protein product [Pleuronectes platessa]|uniref:Uncharacterized protein n=1 Tax=Pleuronectes platessa TaxID=8262 RepID=A0A9N7VSA8_PLEPL|nr:unnamed protein product [Pleuronectes platessa]
MKEVGFMTYTAAGHQSGGCILMGHCSDVSGEALSCAGVKGRGGYGETGRMRDNRQPPQEGPHPSAKVDVIITLNHLTVDLLCRQAQAEGGRPPLAPGRRDTGTVAIVVFGHRAAPCLSPSREQQHKKKAPAETQAPQKPPRPRELRQQRRVRVRRSATPCSEAVAVRLCARVVVSGTRVFVHHTANCAII